MIEVLVILAFVEAQIAVVFALMAFLRPSEKKEELWTPTGEDKQLEEEEEELRGLLKRGKPSRAPGTWAEHKKLFEELIN